MATVYLGLGTNLGDRARNLRQALAALAPQITVTRLSTCYESEPAYVLDQPRFYNIAAQAETALTPLDVLRHLKRLEAELGRVASRRFGPRLIDLDLLLYDAVVLDTPELTLPHPRLAERAFVLVPLAEIAPAVVPPGQGWTLAQLRDHLGATASMLWPVEIQLT